MTYGLNDIKKLMTQNGTKFFQGYNEPARPRRKIICARVRILRRARANRFCRNYAASSCPCRSLIRSGNQR